MCTQSTILPWKYGRKAFQVVKLAYKSVEYSKSLKISVFGFLKQKVYFSQNHKLAQFTVFRLILILFLSQSFLTVSLCANSLKMSCHAWTLSRLWLAFAYTAFLSDTTSDSVNNFCTESTSNTTSEYFKSLELLRCHDVICSFRLVLGWGRQFTPGSSFLQRLLFRKYLPVKNNEILQQVDPIIVWVWSVYFFEDGCKGDLRSRLLVLSSEGLNDFLVNFIRTFERSLIRCFVVFSCEKKTMFLEVRTGSKITEERKHCLCL